MTKGILTLALLSALFLGSCKEAPKKGDVETETTETIEKNIEDIVTTTATDNDGKMLQMTFNNSKGTATLDFNGETIELEAEKAASGIWYKNDNYELRGKGNDIELLKDGEVVFTHSDDIVNTSLKNDKGETLDMTFNNTANTVKVYLNGGEQIELKGEKAASGIWYKNDQYELRGKGDNLELTKDGVTVFKN
ncbi:MliC family protein [Arenibacter latericius]|uniref:MliC family protein n=1 Tax=Arenibacter latericius TaxID=86104 RepID=UPI000421458B|nr:MliC family protein [Arenibacter latericius]